MRYEWDEAKNRSNRAKHGLDFADAERVFVGRRVTFVDDRFDYGEKRLVSLGTLAGRGPSPRPAQERGHAHDLHKKGEPPLAENLSKATWRDLTG